jgi:DNA invertase Pin-like site-specific DNA recombinase
LQDPRSIADQLALAREYADRQGWKVVHEFTDHSISAASRHNRPGVRDLMRAAEERAFDIVLTEAMDRLVRDEEDAHHIFKRLKYWGIDLVTLKSGKTDRIRVSVEAMVASMFLEDLSQKTLRGMIGRAKAGRIPGGRLYGYDIVKGEKDEKGEEKRGLRKRNEQEAEIVRRIFREYVAGVRPKAIVQRLNAKGVPSPRGKRWNVSTLVGSPKRENGTLNNPLYAGRIVFKRQSFTKNPETGRRQSKANAVEERIITEVPELAIVDPETWQAAQDLRASRRRPHPRYHRQPKHLLSDRLVCGACGGSVIVQGSVRRTKYFACSAHINRGGCTNKRHVPGREIERRVLAGLQKLLLDPAKIELAVNAYRERWRQLKAERAKSRSTTERELSTVNTAITRTMKALQSLDGGAPEVLAQSLADLDAQRKRLEGLLAVPKADVIDLHPHLAQRCREIVENLGAEIAAGGLTAEKARALLRSLISSIRITPMPGRQPVGIEIEGNLLALLEADRALAASEPFAKIAVRV